MIWVPSAASAVIASEMASDAACAFSKEVVTTMEVAVTELPVTLSETCERLTEAALANARL
ncbi:MAG: hypothetical protein SGPRY_000247 [Prymnesium sp.]